MIRLARFATLVFCATALAPTLADAQNAMREGTPEAAPASFSSPRPPSTAARKSVRTTLAVVEQPRAIGYFVGDKIAQRVLLESEGRAVAPVALPTPGRVSAWFERRAANVETDASSRHWLVIQYQILNAPPKLITVKLPAWTLAIKGSGAGPTTAALQIPGAPVNVAPLSPPGSPTQVGTADLRADRSPPTVATSPIRRAIAISTGAFLLTLVAWLTWIVWRNRRAQAIQPFARALREMTAFDDREPRAWQALHRAFDRTAGRVIQSSTLPTLFERAPQLLPARGEIEQFFAQSSLLFFGTAPTSRVTSAPGVTSALSTASVPASALSTPTAPTSAPSAASAPSPRDLCIELRRIEKRREQ
jgi:mxaA protein